MTRADATRPAWRAGDVLGARYLNGFVLVPVLGLLGERGVLDALARGPRDLDELASGAARTGRRPPAGGLLGALRTLALRGWTRLDGGPEGTRVGLTAAGHQAVAAWRRSRPGSAVAAAVLDRTGALLGEVTAPVDDATAAVLRRAADSIGSRWGASAAEGPDHWLDHLDGTVACPVLVRAARRRALGAGPDPALTPVLRALRLVDGDGRPTEDGAEQLASAANLAVVVSYAGVLADLDAIVFGGRARSSRDDRHVLREINIWGSAHNSALEVLRADLLDEVLVPIFDAPDLDAQPRGLLDLGCGSGEPLAAAVDRIVAGTRRGRHLDTHPLHAIGADISPVACGRARATLSRRCARPGVHVEVLIADVADPAALDRALRDRDRPGLADLLHSQMFLLHDRELAAGDPATAREGLRAAARRCRPEALADVLTATGAAESADAVDLFVTEQSHDGEVVAAVVPAADLVGLVGRWAPFLRHGLLLVEAHTSAPGTDPAGIDPAPAVWGVHFASGQYLVTAAEHELALVLAGLAPTYLATTGTRGVSAAHWVRADRVYRDVDLPPFAPLGEALAVGSG